MEQADSVSVRIPRSLWERALALVPGLRDAPEFAARRVSPSGVVKLAVHRGLDRLESERRHGGDHE